MTSDRKKPGVAFWATVVVAMLVVAYPLSVGPACWMSSRARAGDEVVTDFYQPILSVIWRGPRAVRRVGEWYVFLFAGDDWSLSCQASKIYWRASGTILPCGMELASDEELAAFDAERHRQQVRQFTLIAERAGLTWMETEMVWQSADGLVKFDSVGTILPSEIE